jgi:multiple sugar transport system permease protein
MIKEFFRKLKYKFSRNVEYVDPFVTDKEGNKVFEDSHFGEVKEGYNEDKNIVVKIVSNNKIDSHFTITGIKDAESTNNWKAWLYLFPVLILISVFLIYPLLDTIAISFMNDYNYVKGTFDGFTFDNFGKVLGLVEINGSYETNFVNYAIPNTFIIVFITVPLSIMIAILISVGLNSLKWFQKVLQTIFFLPYVTNTIAIGMVFSVIFDQNGLINYIFGIDKKWIYGATRWDAMIPLCIYIVWSSLPFKILIFLSGLQGIDKQYYQAAKIDATPQWKVLLKITVPLLSPQILYIMITSFIGAFKEYASVVGLFNGPGTSNGDYNMYTIVYYIYENLSVDTSLAAAAAVILFAIILVFTIFQVLVSKKRVYY